MYVGTFPRWMSKVIFSLFGYIHGQSHIIKGPLILTSNALQHRWGKQIHTLIQRNIIGIGTISAGQLLIVTLLTEGSHL